MLQQIKALRALTEQEKIVISELERQYNLFLATVWKTETDLPCNKKEMDRAKVLLKDALLSSVRSIVLSLRK